MSRCIACGTAEGEINAHGERVAFTQPIFAGVFCDRCVTRRQDNNAAWAALSHRQRIEREERERIERERAERERIERERIAALSAVRPITPWDLRRAAIHEAGHAVIAEHWGVPCERITLGSDGCGTAYLAAFDTLDEGQRWGYRLAVYAGAAAEWIGRGEYLYTCAADMRDCVSDADARILHNTPDDALQGLHSSLEVATNTVHEHWAAIRRVADAILRRAGNSAGNPNGPGAIRTLERAEIRRAIAGPA